MPFANEARIVAAALPANDPLKVVLEYLLLNGVGRSNAIPVDGILQELANHGTTISAVEFQQTILKDTRGGDIFIASSNRGYFLIDDIDDARVMKRFYEARIAAESAHLANLHYLASTLGWQL